MNFVRFVIWKMAYQISDITPFSLQDFIDTPSCIVWFSGCNMVCEYCHNLDLVFQNDNFMGEKEVFDFLQKRIGKLEGVILCGGEPTLYANLLEFCSKIKNMGFKIKLDTNGSNPMMIRNILHLLDFVALDFKSPKEKFKVITNSNLFENFEKTFDILSGSDLDFEIRTTYHSELLTRFEMKKMIDFLEKKNYKKTYYIQNYTKQNIFIRELGKSTMADILNLSSEKFAIKFRNSQNF